MVNFFGSDQIKSVQNGSKRIKLDQTGVSHISTNVTIKCYHICHENQHGQRFWIRSDQIGSKWIKLDYLNLDFSHIKRKIIKWSQGSQPTGQSISSLQQIQTVQSIQSIQTIHYIVYPVSNYPFYPGYPVYNPNL